MSVDQDDFKNIKTMRDINDYCIRKGIPSLAQGMIELPPPQTLRQITAEAVMQDNIHTVIQIKLLNLKIISKTK